MPRKRNTTTWTRAIMIDTHCEYCGIQIRISLTNRTRVFLCAEHHKIYALIRRWNVEAFVAGNPHTLTMAEWYQTVSDFGGLCAYCQEEPWSEIEHFIPIRKSGGTTPNNCAPSCLHCNRAKGQGSIPGLERVRAYLATRPAGVPIWDDSTIGESYNDSTFKVLPRAFYGKELAGAICLP